jgi:phage shock protein C
MKKLYRSSSDRIIAGVCAGLAEYINIDPTIVRLIFVILFLLGAGGFWIYIILWVVVPLPPDHSGNSIEVIEVSKSQTEQSDSTKESESKQ